MCCGQGVGTAVVQLLGEHDLATRTEIHDLFSSLVEETDLVVVDVTEARCIDSTFLLNRAQANLVGRESRVESRESRVESRGSRCA